MNTSSTGSSGDLRARHWIAIAAIGAAACGLYWKTAPREFAAPGSTESTRPLPPSSARPADFKRVPTPAFPLPASERGKSIRGD